VLLPKHSESCPCAFLTADHPPDLPGQTIAVYDVTRRETFEDLDSVWMREVELYSNVEGAMHMVVANKVDLVGVASGR
jgi:hypothetical protein